MRRRSGPANQVVAFFMRDQYLELDVRNPSARNPDLQIIGRKGRARVGCQIFIGTERQDAKNAADLRSAERRGFCLAERAELAGALLDNYGGDLSRQRGGTGARPLREGKDVEIRER